MGSPELTEALVNLAIAVMTVLAVVVSTILVPWLKRFAAAQAEQARAAGHASEVQLLEQLATQAVLWVEQTAKARVGSAAKRTQAALWLQNQAEQRGVVLAEHDAGRLIEAAVRVMKASGLEAGSEPARSTARTRRKPAIPQTEVTG